LIHVETKRTQAKEAHVAGLGSMSFGDQIRTYTLHPYQLVKDHRTQYESTSPKRVLDGDLDGFMEAWLSTREIKLDSLGADLNSTYTK